MLEDYDKARNVCSVKLEGFLGNMKLPKGNQKLKEYFIGLKNQVAKGRQKSKEKEKEEVVVTNLEGQKETWEIKE